MANLLSIYVANSHEVYLLIEGLQNQVTKRVKKGLPVEASHLAGCSSMRKIMTCAARVQCDSEGFKPSTQERKECAARLAVEIIDAAKYLATA